MPSGTVSQNIASQSLLDKRAAAKYLCVSVGSVERLLRAGLPHIKLTPGSAGAVRFALSDLQDFVAAARRIRSGNAA